MSAFLWGSTLYIAHLGDSRAAIGIAMCTGGAAKAVATAPRAPPSAQFLTSTHKPDMPEERKRIEAAGGEVVYLRGCKPYLRGGDFQQRQGDAERPMQLNYSRAFGGLRLKPWGLSASPDLLHLPLNGGHNIDIVIIASDGVWDVMAAEEAVGIAWSAHLMNLSPSQVLTEYALKRHRELESSDNVTVIVLIL